MEEAKSAVKGIDGIVVPGAKDDEPQHDPPTAVAASLPLPLASVTRKPRKLTPLEKKDRDRLRMKEQARRRQQAIKDQYEQAKRFAKEQESSSLWHQQERQEEELVLRRLERDVVDVQRFHPAAAGYSFSSTSQSAPRFSPVFFTYSHALCPPSQAPRHGLHSRGGLYKVRNVPVEAEFQHPACRGYAMAKQDDSRCVSPVFFFSGFEKIPLDKVVMKKDDDQEDEEDTVRSNEATGRGENGHGELSLAAQQRQQESQRRLQAALAVRRSSSTVDTNGTTSSGQLPTPPTCLICKQATITRGCPGCFVFATDIYRKMEASKLTQRLKTPKTQYQEEEEARARHKDLQRQLIMPLLVPRSQNKRQEDDVTIATSTVSVTGEGQEDETSYYSNVLANVHAIRKRRIISNKFITLHVKSLPVGNLISLRVDLKSSVAYLYELYRASSELPNRPLHLLLPTTRGLFYLDERIEEATYVRNGVVNGELLLEDFNLHKSVSLELSSRSAITARSMLSSRSGNDATDLNAESEFLLFAVAILHPRSTPQLVTNYVKQNFCFEPPPDEDETPRTASPVTGLADTFPKWARLESAACLLPKDVDQDLFQLQLRPHIHQMHVFAQTNHALVAAEEREERERLLLLAHQEAKAAKLALKKRLRDQQQPDVSNKVRRALAYFEFVCESTSNPRAPRVAEERLGKLWQCMQLLEEWKILKGGRLLDAERTDVTLALMQQLQDVTSTAFELMVHGSQRLKKDKGGGGALPYPVLCLDGGGKARKLVLRLGTRLGATEQEDHDYGMLLDLDQDFDALEKEKPMKALKRGLSKKTAMASDEQEVRQPAPELWADVEWRSRGGSASLALLASSPDLLRAPFYQIKWPLIVKAYKLVLRRVAFANAKLEEFNALAKVLQSADAVLSKAQLTRWQNDVQRFMETLHEQSALARAAQRVLVKKGVAILKRRAQARRKQLREREKEMERLRQLQLERDRPKLTAAQQLKLVFMRDHAPKIRDALERTPAEKLGLKAGELLGKAASGVVGAARSLKKEYAVRTL